MEHAQRVDKSLFWSIIALVLILILMEHAQREKTKMKPIEVWRVGVLILILMEHAQRDTLTCLTKPYRMS